MAEVKRITEILAWVAIDDDGVEGVIASNRLKVGWITPLVGSDAERMRSVEIEARLIALHGGKALKLVRFTGLEVVKAFDAMGRPAVSEDKAEELRR